MKKKYDFSGWATKNDLLCSDGRIIRRGAFSGNDGTKVPLVFMHDHKNMDNIIGHAYLEERPEGIYAYGFLNDSERGQQAKLLIDHGDISSLSIYANKLKQRGGDVIHGNIKEVSLVLFGANPGAYIDEVEISHSESDGEEGTVLSAIIHNDDDYDLMINEEDTVDIPEDDEFAHAESNENEVKKDMADGKDKTVEDVLNEMTDEQKNVLNYLVGLALEGKESGEVKHSDEGDNDMMYNVFEGDANTVENAGLTHAQLEVIFKDAKKGSMKDAFLAHADEYGIENIEYLFPDARTLENAPSFIKRDDSWVTEFMNATHHTPFSRVKSIHADITEDDARARGYIKGKLKKEEVFPLLKRTTEPCTIYKKQKLDRDDVIDIVDLDVVAWLKTEMRMMLNEEIARAALIGDGRNPASDDKIPEDHIRPIYTDAELYSVKVPVAVSATATEDDVAKAFIRKAIKARKSYKGSGNPILYTTEDMLTNMLLLTDEMGRDLYDTQEKLATKLRVRKIVTVEVMEGAKREVSGAERELLGIIVNPADYNFGADKGGSVNMFDDFDIDYNQMKYLIETRCSGALTKPFSALVLEKVTE